MRKPVIVAAVLMAAAASLALAQKPEMKGGAVVASEPGKAAAVATVQVTATVVAIDKATRTVTLKGPQRTVDVVAGDEVKNFDQIKVGDSVNVTYVEALTLELKKTKGKLDMKAETDAVRASPGQAPGGAVGRQITALCDVVAVDPKKSTITLKGPRGNVMELNVRNKDHFKVVKKGDQVEVVYTEALAMSLSPAAASGAKKK
jgi:hypothetical protein